MTYRPSRRQAAYAAVILAACYAAWLYTRSAKDDGECLSEERSERPSSASPLASSSFDIERLHERKFCKETEDSFPKLPRGLYSSDEESEGEGSSEIAKPVFIEPSEYPCFVKTFGCTHNSSDSETMKGVLSSSGFPLVETMEEARVIVLNSCTVKNPSQEGAINLANLARRKGLFVVIAGCVVQADAELKALESFSVIGVKQLDKIAEAVLETIGGLVYKCLHNPAPGEAEDSLVLPHVRKNKLIEIIPLSNGCLGACTYCKTRFARGVLVSFPKELILNRVREAVEDGCQQIWLSSEDTGSWGLDRNQNIVHLLAAIDDELRCNPKAANVMCRLGMTNPPYILEHLDTVARIMSGPNWFRFLHLPVQSGSDLVLKKMNREYTVADFEVCVSKLRECLPDITIATDFICGFPGETEDDHQESIDLLLKFKMPAVNISQFYSRPGTAAAQMPKVSSSVVKRRSGQMTTAFNSYTTFDDYVGKVVEVWIDGVSDRSAHFVGRTRQYIKVLVNKKYNLELGQKLQVRIEKATKWHVEGKPETHGTRVC